MSSQYDRLKKNALAKAQQNRVNRVNRSVKKSGYDVSKSQKAYIAGDVISSASGKAYNYKKNGLPEDSWITGGRSYANYKKIQEGKNPYETKFYYDGKPRTVTTKDGNTFTSRKRYLTDEEKENLAVRGSMFAKETSDTRTTWLDHDLTGKNKFTDHLNLGKLDGIQVAKNRIKAGKGGKLSNYATGILKDTVGDLVGDGFKLFDRISGTGFAGFAGFLEESANAFEAIADPNIKFKDNVNLNRPLENIKSHLEKSDKEGFGKNLGNFFNEAVERNTEKENERLLNTLNSLPANERTPEVEKYYKDQIERNEYIANDEKQKMMREVVGIAGEMVAPFDLGSSAFKLGKNLVGNTFKTGKAMLNGTADISVGFKNSDSVLDILTGHTKKTSGVLDNALNNEYERVMSKAEDVKEVVKANPKTQNLGSFLDEIGENIPTGTQRSIDGRTLNKKYTQTKDDYVPQLLRGEEVVDDVAKNGQIDGQLNLLDEYDKVSNPVIPETQGEEYYFKSISKFNDGTIRGVTRYVDEMPVEQADRFYDWLEINDPELFYKLTDDISLDAQREVSKLLEGQVLPQHTNENYLTNPIKKSKEDIFNNSIEQNRKLANQYDELNKSRLLQDDIEIAPRKTYNELKEDFVNYGNKIKEQLKNGDTTFINKLQEVLPKINYNKLAKDNNYRVEVINKLNKELFGTDYIRQNVKSRNLKPFLEHLEDIMNYNLTKQQGLYSFKPKGTYNGTRKGVHYMFDRNGVPNDINLNSSFFSPSIIDSNFEDKMNHVNKLVGVEFKSELTEPFKKLKEIAMKQGEKLLSAKDKELAQSVKKGTSSDSVKAYLDNKKLELGLSKLSPEQQKQYKSLESRIKIRDEAYEQIKHMDEQEWLDFMSKNDRSYNEAVKEASINSKDFKRAQTKEQMYSPDGDFKNSSSGEISVTHGRTEAGVAQYEEAFKTKMLTDLKLDSPYYKDFEKLPKGKKLNFVEFSRHKQGRKVLKNIKKLTDKLIETEAKYGSSYTSVSGLEARIIREEMKDIVSNLKRYGIDENIWKKQLDDYVNFRTKASVNTNKEAISPLEKAGLTINNKRGVIGSKNNSKFMEEIYLENKFKDNFFIDEYERALESVSPKDLLNSNHRPRYEGEIASHGDNVGTKVKSSKQLNIDGRTLNKKRTQTKDGYVPQTLRNVDEAEDVIQNANGSEQLSIFDNLLNGSNGSKPKGKLASFLESIEKKFANSDISESSLEKILESKKKKYLRQNGVSDANNPLYKNFKLKDGELPATSAKRLQNGNVVDLESGQVKYANQNKGDLKNIMQDNKYHYKNKEENELIENLLSNPEAKPEHFMALFDKMKIKCDFSDEKSVQKAFERFDYIVNKKIQRGDIVLNKPDDIAQSASRSYNARNLKEFDDSPLSVLAEKLAEAKKYGDDVSAEYFEKQIHSRGTDEIINNIKQARTTEEKQMLYERLMQQADYAYDSNKGLNYYEEMTDWLMNQGGLDVREKNAIIDYMKREQAELASRGIDPNIIENKEMREAMRKNVYSSQVNSDVNRATNDNILDNIIKETQSKPHENILDKMRENIIKESEHLEIPYKEIEKKDREYLELIDKLKNNLSRAEQQKLYERLMQQSEHAYNKKDTGVFDDEYLKELSDWLMKEGGLDVREKNAFIDYMKKEQIKLAERGIDPNTVENKEMREAMRKNTYNRNTNRDAEIVEARDKDLKNILEKEKNRKPNQRIIDEIEKPTTLVEEIKSGRKKKKRIRVKEAEEQVTKNLEMDRQIDEKVANYKNSNKETPLDNIKPSKETPLDNVPTRNADDMLDNELSGKNIGESLDKDIARLEEDLRKENPTTFEKFKKFFTEKSEDARIGYEDDGIYKAYKAWLNTYKKGLTIYNPGWHVANFLQNKGQNYLALGGKAFGSQKNARKVLAHINGKDKGALEFVTKNGRVYTKEELAKLAKDLGVAEGLGTNTSKSHGVFPWLETKIDNSKMMQGALQSEQTARLHHFLTQLERGKTPEQAVKSVNDYLFDYGSKSKADKLMSDFVDPFWSFHKNNAKMLIKAPFKDSKNANNILRAGEILDTIVSEDDRRSNEYRSHQLPFGSFKDEINGDEYTYHYDNHILPEVDSPLPMERDEWENKLNPIVRLALQQSRGEGNFGNKIVDKDESDWGEVTKDERLKEIGLELNPVLNSFFKKFDKASYHQKKTDEGKQSQETTDKQILNEWLAYILGNKGNYYRNRE